MGKDIHKKKGFLKIDGPVTIIWSRPYSLRHKPNKGRSEITLHQTITRQSTLLRMANHQQTHGRNELRLGPTTPSDPEEWQRKIRPKWPVFR